MAKTSIGTNNLSHENQFPKSCLDLVTLLQLQLKVANPQVQGTKNLAYPRASNISFDRGMAYLFEHVHLFIGW